MTGKLLTTKEVAEQLRISEDSLRRMRMFGRGPAYLKFGEVRAPRSSVRYRQEDVDRYISESLIETRGSAA